MSIQKKCLGCGAEVTWIKTGRGEKVPVNKEPVRVILKDRGPGDAFFQKDGSLIFGWEIGDVGDYDPDANVVEAYRSHYITCDVANFRNRQPRRRAPGFR